MKKILITGASGFIGSFLVEEALKKEYEVHAGVRSSSSRKYLSDSRLRFFNLDFGNKSLLETRFLQFKEQNGNFDAVIHNAGITKAKNKEEFLTVNYEYTKNLVNALIDSGNIPEKFIYISSLASFGPRKDKELISHSDTPRPITAYGRSKLKSEQFLNSITDFPSVIIRPSAVYGPRDHEFFVLYKSINRGIEPYLGNKDQLLSFVHVGDLANAIFKVVETPKKDHAYFVSDGFVYSIQTFMEAARKYLKKKTISIVIPSVLTWPLAYSIEKISFALGRTATFNRERLKEYESFNWSCDSKPLSNDTFFTPKYNLETGMKETIEWYKKERWL